jgi:hypothetical protein
MRYSRREKDEKERSERATHIYIYIYMEREKERERERGEKNLLCQQIRFGFGSPVHRITPN